MDNTLFIINQTSPITYVTTDNSPFLIVHGNKDTVLPFSQSEMFSAKLIEKKVIVKSIVIEEGNHSLGTKKVKALIQKHILVNSSNCLTFTFET